VSAADRGLWVGVAAGTPILGITALQARTEAADVHPGELARWIVGGALVVDLVVIPLALLAAWAVRRRRWARWPLAASATLLLVAWPFLSGYGRSRSNPSLLPRDHTAGTLVAIAVVWALALTLALVRPRERWQRRTRR
jgi:hypothetical protein